MMRQSLTWIARILVIVAGVAFIAYHITWRDYTDAQGVAHEGIIRTLAGARWEWLLLGLAMVGLILPMQIVRWFMLMRARGLDATIGRTFRLYFVGLFFNFCLPLSTGGDVVKAYYAAKRSDRRADAMFSVLADRMTGLFGLLILAGALGYFSWRDPSARRVTIIIWSMLGVAGVTSLLYFSQALHRIARLEVILNKLPGRRIWVAVDQAAMAYRSTPGVVITAVSISVVVQFLLATATSLAGYALGMQTPWIVLLTVVPLVHMSGLLPSYQGVGWMEAVAFALLEQPEVATRNQIVGMLMIARLYLLCYALIGSLLLLRGDIHLHPEIDRGANDQ